MEKSNQNLGLFLEDLQKKGRYTLTKKEAEEVLKRGGTALMQQAYRLFKKKKIFAPRRGFWVILPPEYRGDAVMPASWYIHDLMDFEKMPYYVGLLSAAALYGASHQKPQEFQVIVPKQMRNIVGGVHFFKKGSFSLKHTQPHHTMTGYINVSSPALTAFDLIKYMSSVGHISHVATVLEELSESISQKDLRTVLEEESHLPTAQRLGFLLQSLQKTNLFKTVEKWLHGKEKRTVLLSPSGGKRQGKTDALWGVLVNEDIEVDA